MPHLADHPLTMKRMPDGIDGESFYEKSAPSHTPDWLGRCAVQSDDAEEGRDRLPDDRRRRRPALHREPGLHRVPPAARALQRRRRIPTTCSSTSTRSSPTRTRTCSRSARHIKVLLDQLGLTSFPKTSGATGLQIFVPILRGTYTHDNVRAFVGAAGRMIKRADPDRVTMAWKIADRTGKIFIDHNMNRSGANIAAAYSRATGAARARSRRRSRGTRSSRAGSSRRTSGSTTCGIASSASAICSTACARRRWT